MITYKPVITLSGRRKDGTWPVKIRVTFKGVVRRLPTTLVCTEADITRSGKIKNATILQRAAELIATMREATADLSPFTLEGWDVDQVVDHIRAALTAQEFRLDFFEFADAYLVCKQGRTRHVYDTAFRTLERFLGCRRLDVNDITRDLLLRFVEFVDAEPMMHRNRDGSYTPTQRTKPRGGASAALLGKLAHVFEQAKWRCNNEDTGRILIPRSPFDGLTKHYPPGKGERPLSVEEMQRIIDCKPEDWLAVLARAAFLLSFVTMGANLADLREARGPVGEVWTYNRLKTRERRADKAEVRVRLPAVSSSLVASLGGLPGRSGWWLPELHRWKDENTAVGMVNDGLRRVCDLARVEPSVTFYAGRKTFGTLARKLGVEKATIDDALAHVGDFRVTDIYAERNWELTWEALDKVLALFDFGQQ